MPTIGASIGHEGRRKLYAAASHPGRKREPGVHERMAKLADTVVLCRADGSKATALTTAHWPREDWHTIVKAFLAGEYVRTDSGALVFTE